MIEFITAYSGEIAICLSLGCLVLLVSLLIGQKKRAKQADERIQEAMHILSHDMEDALRPFMGREELAQTLYAQTQQSLAQMNELTRTELARFDAFDARFDAFSAAQESRTRAQNALLEEKLHLSEQRIEKMRETLEKSVSSLQAENGKKLDEMRQTVDEKLHSTLEKRLTESFGQVSQQLEMVSKGLGEMRALAGGVGDLKRVLTNVKTRGVWGEMQLGTLISQMLTKGQYDENVAVTPGSSMRVEYAVKLPGQGDLPVYLPIDAKFPLEDYERLLSAGDSGDPALVLTARQALESALRTEGKRIASKYIDPPYTTDFAIMFLPTEGLYAEALRARGLTEELQEKLRVVIAGPTTLGALLTSLQIGFKTLAIEKSSSEVWKLLGAVKTEFSRFTDLLDAAQKRMHAASETIERASTRSRAITRKLKSVESLDAGESVQYLGTDDDTPDVGGDE